MGDFRHRATTVVKSQGQWRADFPTMSLPRVWTAEVCAELNLDPVFESPKPTPGPYQTVVSNGVTQDANNNWVQAWSLVDMFADTTEDGVTTTKAEHEAAYQSRLDSEAAASVRAQRDQLLAECDWVAIRARELGQSVPDNWYTYRGDLRQVPEQSGFPHDVTWPEKPER